MVVEKGGGQICSPTTTDHCHGLTIGLIFRCVVHNRHNHGAHSFDKAMLELKLAQSKVFAQCRYFINEFVYIWFTTALRAFGNLHRLSANHR